MPSAATAAQTGAAGMVSGSDCVENGTSTIDEKSRLPVVIAIPDTLIIFLETRFKATP